MKLRRTIALLLALSTLLGLFAGCGKTEKGDVTTTEEETTTAVQQAEAVIGELKEDGSVSLITNPDGSPTSIIGSDGNQYEIPADSTAIAVKDEQGTVTAIKLNNGTSIPVSVSSDGSKLIVKEVISSVTTTNSDVTDPGVTGTTSPKNVTTTAKSNETTTKKASAKVLERDDVQAILNDPSKNAIQKAEAIKTNSSLTPEEKALIIDQMDGLSKEQKATLLNEVAIVSYTYSKDGYFFTDDNNAWQRSFGYNKFYDLAASYVVMYYDTVRVKFNHGNLDWMIQLWKGQYGYLFLGSEIGVYTKDPKQSADHYNCASDDNLLDMSMSLFRVNKLTKEHTLLFNRDFGPHWWITGFVPGILNSFSKRDELIMTASIKFKDASMAQKFASGLAGAGFSSGSPSHNNVDKYSVSGALVSFSWRYIDQGLGRVKPDKGGSKTTAAPTTKAPEVTKVPETTKAPETKEITVKFNAGGGDVSVGSAKYTVGKAYGTLPTPHRSGYEFVGWFDSFILGNRITTSSIVSKSVSTLYARWSKSDEDDTTKAPEVTNAPETPDSGSSN